ncbi:Mitochondrial import inner membrane translocase subunit TIM22-1 [Striga hermonthica]|uniref:Mitochondrial import inner membrane translocase subunit TIM22-1 n=1 Tax=Striga hermonthica TaxID=68872 RepID=A0A9N7MQ67_STRHE|nr:Mitochondrial import inner membrane translocase subunit TIM22-1 [Striga hermonthica]
MQGRSRAGSCELQQVGMAIWPGADLAWSDLQPLGRVGPAPLSKQARSGLARSLNGPGRSTPRRVGTGSGSRLSARPAPLPTKSDLKPSPIISKAPLMSSNPDSEQNASSSTQEAPTPQIEPIRLPTVEEIRGQDIWNNCAVRSVVSGVMGGGLGLFMGLFLGALDNPLMQDEMTGRQQLVYQAKQMGRRSWSSCKAFAIMGFVFSASECVVEKARAKHDITNTVVAGCVTGGAISARGGPKAACAGCAGFAAFSVVIEKFLERHS